MKNDFKKQFSVDREYYLNKLDFLNWFRYYYLVKDVLRLQTLSVLEIGTGSGIVRNCLKPLVQKYWVLDINAKLSPDIVSDVRERQAKIVSRFDCVIAADVLEHLPFSDLSKAVKNLYEYLKPGGYALITIPHRQSNFLFMSPNQIPRVITVPTGFLSVGAFWRRFIKRKIWIDPHHYWEIGDGNIKIKDLRDCFSHNGFKEVDFQKLLYVDYWILIKPKS